MVVVCAAWGNLVDKKNSETMQDQRKWAVRDEGRRGVTTGWWTVKAGEKKGRIGGWKIVKYSMSALGEERGKNWTREGCCPREDVKNGENSTLGEETMGRNVRFRNRKKRSDARKKRVEPVALGGKKTPHIKKNDLSENQKPVGGVKSAIGGRYKKEMKSIERGERGRGIREGNEKNKWKLRRGKRKVKAKVKRPA